MPFLHFFFSRMSMEPYPGVTAEVKADLENIDFGAAAARIQSKLKQRNTPLNVAITGESGSGKCFQRHW